MEVEVLGTHMISMVEDLAIFEIDESELTAVSGFMNYKGEVEPYIVRYKCKYMLADFIRPNLGRG